MSHRAYAKPTDEVLRQRLTPLEYEVTQHGATEPPFRNRYYDHHAPGIYVDVTTGEPLFSSLDKFESGTGWPSFTRPLSKDSVVERVDHSHGMKRTEVRSRVGDAHLGHVFDDGPAPTRLRYCMNSAALRFIPAERLEAEGYGEFRALFAGSGQSKEAKLGGNAAPEANACTTPPAGEQAGCTATLETVVLAGGCFWGMEDILRTVPGVLETEVGYTGGTTPNPTYSEVKTGRSGHAESVRIVFDPARISFAELLENWFFRMHDPTTVNRQGNDVGTQYRSAIFVTSDEQRRVAEEVRARVAQKGRWRAPIATEVVNAGRFTPAEDYHQDYLEKNPGGYTCHYLRP